MLLAAAAVVIMAGSAHATTPEIEYGNYWQPTDYRNESFIVQTGQVSWASVTQTGDQNYSTINQSGTSDTATVIQNSECCVQGSCHCGPSWAGYPIYTSSDYQNYSKITQSGSGFHDAYVKQDGDGNKSTIDQKGLYDTAKVYQDGGFNTSEIAQSGTGVNNAIVDQDGDLNKSYITQGSGINTACVDQDGFGNYSKVNQGGTAASVNLASVNQVGYMNSSDISQTGCGLHTATVSQTNNCFSASAKYCPIVR
jgi:hypothetical protein